LNKNSLIYVAGHSGLAGSAIVRELALRGYKNLLLKPHSELDLRNSEDVEYFLKKHKPRAIFMAAAHSGGILEAVKNPAWMLMDNLEIITNVIRAAFIINVEKLIFLASSCIYPINAKQPYKEEDLGNGRTDENWSYAVAKLAGLELCRAFNKQYDCSYTTLVPCNLYGTRDNFDPTRSHVIPNIIRKLHESDSIELWGDGTAKREFLYSGDFASAAVDVFERGHEDVINIGSGSDISILDLVQIVATVVRPGQEIKVSFNTKMPNGVASKLMDNSRIKALGWKPKVDLREGISKTYDWWKAQN
jgi:GDP-L-fucose synthase